MNLGILLLTKVVHGESGDAKPGVLAMVLAAATFLLLAVWPALSASRTYQDHEGYELLSTMLDKEAEDWREHHLDVKNLPIYNRSTKEFQCNNEIPEEFKAAAEDLARIPDRHFSFARKFTLRYPYSLTDAGYIRITAVGFDPTRTHAIAYVSRGCGAMCSGGHTYLFRKGKQVWEIVDRVCETMS